MIVAKEQSAELLWVTPNPSHVIAQAARVSTAKEAPETLEECRVFVKKLVDWGHLTPLEFVSLTFRVECSRAVSHELVRHRLMSIVQQSQRYVGYDVLVVVEPVQVGRGNVLVRAVWQCAQRFGFACYRLLLKLGVRKEDARTVLSTATGTRMFVQMNLREFRHFLSLRTDKAAWVEMRLLANRMARAFAKRYPDEVYLIDDVWKERGL